MSNQFLLVRTVVDEEGVWYAARGLFLEPTPLARGEVLGVPRSLLNFYWNLRSFVYMTRQSLHHGKCSELGALSHCRLHVVRFRYRKPAQRFWNRVQPFGLDFEPRCDGSTSNSRRDFRRTGSGKPVAAVIVAKYHFEERLVGKPSANFMNKFWHFICGLLRLAFKWYNSWHSHVKLDDCRHLFCGILHCNGNNFIVLTTFRLSVFSSCWFSGQKSHTMFATAS